MHYLLHNASQDKPNRIVYYSTDHESIISWKNDTGFELYATFSNLVTKAEAITGCNNILKWIQSEESKLFIYQSPLWT